MACRNESLLRLPRPDALDGLVQSVETGRTCRVDSVAGTTQVKIVRDAVGKNRLVVARGVEHGSVVRIAEISQAVVRGRTANKNTNVLANDGLLRHTCVLERLVRAFKQDALLGIWGEFSKEQITSNGKSYLTIVPPGR